MKKKLHHLILKRLNHKKKTTVVPDQIEHHSVWGFKDSFFELTHQRALIMRGQRYALSGQELPYIVPWIENLMKIKLAPSKALTPNYPPQIPASRLSSECMAALLKKFEPEQLTSDPFLRLRNGHGQTQGEMYAINYKNGISRIPDLIFYPKNEQDIIDIVAIAKTQNLVLIPKGGGTNVTEALKCPENELRCIVSVDMKLMNKILWVDVINRTACVQAGAVGRHIVSELADQGFTLGHEPDSIEFSTMGGWIATNASGMKKNKYGNIENIVLDLNIVSSQGLITWSNHAPRESIGIDLRRMVFGSEGNLGIVTQAIVKIEKLPQVQKYASIVFPDFECGVQFMYELSQSNQLPASVRLVDNPQFQFGQALKPKSESVKALKSKAEKFYVTQLKGFKVDSICACTVVYEGTSREVEIQEKLISAIAEKHQGIDGGAENGKRGYQLTFGIAYIRDFIMKHNIIAESFETSVPWSKVVTLCDRVKRRVMSEHLQRNLPGLPFVSCRVTQIYQTGVCIYFYLGISTEGVENPSDVFTEIEHIARQEILDAGGSLSHHHGIGKIRQNFMPQIMSSGAYDMLGEIKKIWDPGDVFAVRN